MALIINMNTVNRQIPERISAIELDKCTSQGIIVT